MSPSSPLAMPARSIMNSTYVRILIQHMNDSEIRSVGLHSALFTLDLQRTTAQIAPISSHVHETCLQWQEDLPDWKQYLLLPTD